MDQGQAVFMLFASMRTMPKKWFPQQRLSVWMTANAAATYRSNLGRPPGKCQNGQSQPLILLAVGEKSVAFPRYTGRVQMHPRLRPAMCIVLCIIVRQISHIKYQLLIQRLVLFFTPWRLKSPDGKGFSGVFLKRYPETSIIPIMQTDAEGRIAFRACFLPHLIQNDSFLSFAKSFN